MVDKTQTHRLVMDYYTNHRPMYKTQTNEPNFMDGSDKTWTVTDYFHGQNNNVIWRTLHSGFEQLEGRTNQLYITFLKFYPYQCSARTMGWFILQIKGSQVIVSNFFLSLMIGFILANSVNPYKMPFNVISYESSLFSHLPVYRKGLKLYHLLQMEYLLLII